MSYRLQFIGNMILIGSVPLLVVNVGLSSVAITQWRTLIGCIFLFSLSLIGKKAVDWAAIRKSWKPLLCSGICLAGNWILLFESYQTISVGVAIIICYAAPVLVFILSPLLFGTKTTKSEVIGIIASAAGVVLMNLSGQLGGATGTSLILPILASVCYAGVLITGRFIEGVSGRDITLVQMLISFVIATLYSSLRMGRFMEIPVGLDWLLILVMGILHTSIGYMLFFHLIKKIPSQEFALLSYVEPASALVFSAVFLKERLVWFQILGAILVFGGVIYAQLKAASGTTETEGRMERGPE